MLIAAEDDPARTLVPRLIAAGADLSRIKFLRPVKATELVKSGRDEVMSTSLRELQLQADLDALRETLKANPDIALVILDPITGYFGCDQNKDRELRPVMNKLKDVCEETGVAVMAISHHNKKSDLDALQKILGASSFAGAARAIWALSRDPEDPSIRHMAVVKMNVGEEVGGLKFTLTGTTVDGVKTSFADWQGTTSETADSLIAKQKELAKTGRPDVQKEQARLFLKLTLEGGARLGRELFAEAEAVGISEGTLKRAKYELNVRAYQKPGSERGWWWALPEAAQETSLSITEIV